MHKTVQVTYPEAPAVPGLDPDILKWIGITLKELWDSILKYDRAVVAEIDNYTELTLEKEFELNAWGGFKDPPRGVVEGKTRQGFNAHKNFGTAGTEGWVAYVFDRAFFLMFYWDNPMIGSNSGVASFIPRTEDLNRKTLEKYSDRDNVIPEVGDWKCGVSVGSGDQAKFNYYVYQKK